MGLGARELNIVHSIRAWYSWGEKIHLGTYKRSIWNRGAWGAETFALTTNFILVSFEKWHSRAWGRSSGGTSAGDRRKYRKVRQGEKEIYTEKV